MEIYSSFYDLRRLSSQWHKHSIRLLEKNMPEDCVLYKIETIYNYEKCLEDIILPNKMIVNHPNKIYKIMD